MIRCSRTRQAIKGCGIDKVEPRVATSLVSSTAQATVHATKTIEKATPLKQKHCCEPTEAIQGTNAIKERAEVVGQSLAVAKSGIVKLSQQLRFSLPLSITLLPLFLFDRHPPIKNDDICSRICQRALLYPSSIVDINVMSAVRPLLVLNTCNAIDGDTWQMHLSMPARYVISCFPGEMRS